MRVTLIATGGGKNVLIVAARDLNIESRQDTDDYRERNRTSGAQISLCIPPFCYGATVSATVQDSKGRIDSTFASVKGCVLSQTGRHALEITVAYDSKLM